MRAPAPLLAILLTALLARAATAQGGPALVAVAQASEAEIREARTFVGSVVPARTSRVAAEAAGLVAATLVRRGDRVAARQPLARLDTRTVEVLLAAARAELELRRAEQTELENGTRPAELEQARARLAAAVAEEEFRTWKLAGARRLFEEKTSSEEELQLAVSASRQAHERRREAEKSLELAIEGPRPERLAQARARTAAQEQEAQRLVDELRRHVVLAPFDGYVVAELTQEGEWVEKGRAVAELVALDSVEIEIGVVEEAVRHLRGGLEAAVTVAALPGEAFVGTLARVVPQGDTRTRTFPVRILLANWRTGDEVLLKAGMIASVTLAAGEPGRAVLVPKDALVLGAGPTPLVFVVEAKEGGGEAARAVPVRVGVAQGGRIQVIGEIAAGALVVVRGNERLRPGQAVRVAERIDGND
ncbi:MAG: efflux RND transporter periplasmic adaptor subunit [Planctomycetaceae bacterium]